MSGLLFAKGGAVSLGLEIGRGGEGAVYQLGADRAVKLYLKPPPPEKVEKLKAMAAVASSGLLKMAAWPADLARKSQR
jgi:DNA-binding helix-hairpin-helix protein with protein kinase domain